MNVINGKTVLITGASSGIGKQLALDLAQNGARVLMVARRIERLQEIEEDIHSRGGQAVSLAYDLSSESERLALIEKILNMSTPVDILINNAGLGWYGYYAEMPWSVADSIMKVNVTAVLSLTRALLPGMHARGQGHIINIGSIAGGFPNQGVAVYSASKAFMDAFTTALHREMTGSGVHVSVARLGPVKTEFYESAIERKKGRKIPGELFAISVERASQAIIRLARRPRRYIYVPSILLLSRVVEDLLGGVIDKLGPLLLRRKDTPANSH